MTQKNRKTKGMMLKQLDEKIDESLERINKLDKKPIQETRERAPVQRRP